MVLLVQVGLAINRYGNRDITWLKHGMLRLEISVMKRLFELPVAKIIEVRKLTFLLNLFM